MTDTAEPLAPERLRRRCDPATLDFETTDTLDDLDIVLGQDRAGEAVKFGIGIRHPGYNLFALGPAGTGRHSVVRQYLEEAARGDAVPDDCCYVHDFDEPHKPQALELPAGRGRALADDMDKLIEELQAAIPAVFESEDYRARRQALETEFKERHEERFSELHERAEKQNIAVIRTPMGLTLAPVKDGEVLGPDEFNKLPEDERKTIEADIETLQQDLQALLREVPRWEREQREQLRELNREFTAFAVNHQLEELRERYADLEQVVAFLTAVEADVLDNAQDFLKAARQQQQGPRPIGIPMPAEEPPSFRRYQVNVLVDNADQTGAPIVYEDHPTYQNLIGQVEHLTQFGTLVTDHMLIRAGALHRANGGYLILDAHRVLMQPFAWEGLKRALGAREVRIESIGQMMSLISTISLEPESIGLELKVVLVGERMLYYLLSELDPDFPELFKVPADFADRMHREDDPAAFGRLIARLVRYNELRPLDREAVARVVEESSRWAEDSEKLSTHMRTLSDLLREADHFARQGKREVVSAADVAQAVDARIHRSDRIYELIREQIARGVLLVDTEGAEVGQINGLAVTELAGFAFGRPSRITARVRLGKGHVVDIEREVELGGPIHSKGVLILTGYLGGRYALDKPLALAASLVFEQSYGGTEGDSASMAELLALLSALAEVPLKQSLAITGSVNQRGRAQAIGGVNQKIEGHFDVCRAAGLTGEQGVVIPRANVAHLMLRPDVVEACEKGTFRVHAIDTVDAALALMTGRDAGERGADGSFPEGSVNRAVEDKLAELAARAHAFAVSARGEDGT